MGLEGCSASALLALLRVLVVGVSAPLMPAEGWGCRTA